MVVSVDYDGALCFEPDLSLFKQEEMRDKGVFLVYKD
jgi:hypothetical protein